MEDNSKQTTNNVNKDTKPKDKTKIEKTELVNIKIIKLLTL